MGDDPFFGGDDSIPLDPVVENGMSGDGREQPYSFLTNQAINREDTITLKRIESDDLIVDLVRNAAGIEIVFTENGTIEMHETKHQMMSLPGAKKLYFYLRGLLNPVTTLTHWEPEEIREHLKNTCHAFTKWLVLNWKDIELEKSMTEMIINNFRVVVHSKLNQALKGRMNLSLNESRQLVKQEMNDTTQRGWRRRPRHNAQMEDDGR